MEHEGYMRMALELAREAAADELSGSCGSVIDLFFERYPHHPRVFAGCLAEESAALLRSFFSSLR